MGSLASCVSSPGCWGPLPTGAACPLPSRRGSGQPGPTACLLRGRARQAGRGSSSPGQPQATPENLALLHLLVLYPVRAVTPPPTPQLPRPQAFPGRPPCLWPSARDLVSGWYEARKSHLCPSRLDSVAHRWIFNSRFSQSASWLELVHTHTPPSLFTPRSAASSRDECDLCRFLLGTRGLRGSTHYRRLYWAFPDPRSPWRLPLGKATWALGTPENVGHPSTGSSLGLLSLLEPLACGHLELQPVATLRKGPGMTAAPLGRAQPSLES